MSRNPKRKASGVVVFLTILILLMIGASAYMVYLCVDLVNQEPTVTVPDTVISLPTAPPETTAEPTQTLPPETTEPYDPVVSTATIGAVGDLLMHKQLFQKASNSVTYQEDGSYDFSAIFQYLKPYAESYDYAIANLETTLSGDNYPYQGNPFFNTPDSLLDSVKDAGFDMLLTANNHIYDCNMPGLLRTMEKIEEQGLRYIGSRETEEDSRYQVVDVNGIRVGMVCYTFTTSMQSGKPRLNGNTPVENPALVNYFFAGNLDVFYEELQGVYDAMESDGAEATVIYIHWGNEYELKQDATQEKIAQKLCDIGFDAIVGGHPHVVQPMALLESTVDPAHKTVCIYSLGNVVSNQRISEMRLRTGHTEDGALLTLTFAKYDDGTVALTGTDVLPTWTNMHYNNGGREYNILPLDDATRDQWAETYKLDDSTLSQAQASYDRTIKMVGDGLKECQTWLEEQNTSRLAQYQNQAA